MYDGLKEKGARQDRDDYMRNMQNLLECFKGGAPPSQMADICLHSTPDGFND